MLEQPFDAARRRILAGAGVLVGTSGLPLVAQAQAQPGQDQPRRGGHLRLGISDFSTADSLDPTKLHSQFENNIHWLLRNNLVEVGPGGKLIPELAESWEASPDAKTWTFKLRSGVQFSDGKPLTPADVIHSFRLHLGDQTKSGAKPFVAQIAEMKADGPSTLVFTLKDGNVGFPALTSFAGLFIVPEGDTTFEKGIGTGGYTLQEFQPGVKAVLRRNPNYWKAGRAHFDSIELICIKDSTARANALLTGQLDAYQAVDPKTVRLLERNKAIRINRVRSKAHYVFPMHVDQAPFDNPDVRLAMKLAIDRDDIVKRVLGGFGSAGNDQPLSSAYPLHKDGVPAQRRYDPEQARSLLKKAGHADLRVQLHVSETPFAGATDAAVLFKSHAEKAGITIDVVKVPEDGYWTSVWNKRPLCTSRWSGRVTEDVILSLSYTGEGIKAGWNETQLNDAKVNDLVAAARREFDEGKRREMYGELQQRIHDIGGSNIFAFADFIDAVSTKVRHGELSGEWMLDGARAGERWWFG